MTAPDDYRRYTTARLYEREKQLQQVQRKVDGEEIDAELEAVREVLKERDIKKNDVELANVWGEQANREAELKRRER